MSRAVVWADHSLVCRDGTVLVARVWQPAEGGSWPVLLMRQPYGRAIASTPTYAHPSWYAAAGFVVVVQDVRGTGDSGGTFGGFDQEGRDGAETVLWARRLPGSNGRLGCYGFSYQGLTQLLNNDPEQRPEALPDALAPAMCGLDERSHWSASGGAHWWALSLAWGLQLAALQCRRAGDRQGWLSICRSLASTTFLEDGLALLERHDPHNMVLGWLQLDPARAEGWTEHAVDPRLWRRPMLLIGGWHDPQLKGVLDLYRRARQAGSTPWLRIGAWTHLNWQGGLDRLQLAFFQHHLQDQQSAGSELAHHTQLSHSTLLQDQLQLRWLVRSPLASSSQRWGLRSAGLAAIDAAEGSLGATPGEGTVTVVHDPWRPLPGRGGHLGLDAGLVERSDLDARSDVACFTTAACSVPLELFGQPQLTLVAVADQPGFDLCTVLSRFTPEGVVHQLSTGIQRCLGDGCLQHQTVRIDFQPVLATLEPGDRLRLSIGLAAWPQHSVNPGSGHGAAAVLGLDHRVITVQLLLAEASLCIGPLLGPN